jgi:hypothetical protein
MRTHAHIPKPEENWPSENIEKSSVRKLSPIANSSDPVDVYFKRMGLFPRQYGAFSMHDHPFSGDISVYGNTMVSRIFYKSSTITVSFLESSSRDAPLRLLGDGILLTVPK